MKEEEKIRRKRGRGRRGEEEEEKKEHLSNVGGIREGFPEQVHLS